MIENKVLTFNHFLAKVLTFIHPCHNDDCLPILTKELTFSKA
jgi:hypothetical protein